MSASWNVKFIANTRGKVYKISKMSLKQVNYHIAECKGKISTSKIHLEGLYKRRAELLQEPLEKGKTKRKILELLKFKQEIKEVSNEQNTSVEEAERMQAILLMALNHLQKGADISLIEAILKQARDNDD